MKLSALGYSSIGLTILVATSSVVSADDLALFQGTWEMTGTNAGTSIRVVKTIEGKKETVEVYSNGILTQKHHVEFELKAYGPAKVFSWKNGQITAGSKAGQPLPDGRFIYRIGKKAIISVHGMLEGDRTSILREVFKRVGEPPALPATKP